MVIEFNIDNGWKLNSLHVQMHKGIKCQEGAVVLSNVCLYCWKEPLNFIKKKNISDTLQFHKHKS